MLRACVNVCVCVCLLMCMCVGYIHTMHMWYIYNFLLQIIKLRLQLYRFIIHVLREHCNHPRAIDVSFSRVGQHRFSFSNEVHFSFPPPGNTAVGFSPPPLLSPPMRGAASLLGRA